MSWTRQMWRVSIVLTVLALRAQAQKGSAPELQLSCGLVSASGWDRDPVGRMKLIEDTATGKSWRVETNAGAPGSPARLIELPTGNQRVGAAGESREPLMVHEGDVLKVSQETPALHADFAAVAMRGGRNREWIRVRLRLSGRVALAQISGPTRASLVHDIGEVCR
jgi:hypothetical protein